MIGAAGDPPAWSRFPGPMVETLEVSRLGVILPGDGDDTPARSRRPASENFDNLPACSRPDYRDCSKLTMT